MPSDDHDRIVRLEVELAALNRLNDERDKLLVQRFEIEGRTLATAIETLRTEYKTGHDGLVGRVDVLAQVVAQSSGTAAGTMRIFLVAAVGISLLSLIAGFVDVLSR